MPSDVRALIITGFGLNCEAETARAFSLAGAVAEQVHLNDLLLRRVRLGLLVPNGGLDQMARIRSIVQPEFGWDNKRWEAEEKSYAELWRTAYRLG